MKKTLLFPLTAIALTLSANSYAGERTKDEQINEAIGFGTGATAGALLGGPVGFVIGGVFGVLVADDVNDKNELERTELALSRQTNTVRQQKAKLIALQSEYERAMADQAIQLVTLEKEIEKVMQEIESHVLFRTASSTIEDHFKTQLNLVAQGLKDNPELVVTLSGYADSRGDDTYNQSLSTDRAMSVKNYLISQGVKEKQVVTIAYGEAQPVSAQNTAEDFFFDRRVLVHVAQGNQALTASNP